MLEAGTLVWVKDEALNKTHPAHSSNSDWVRDYGRLYIIDEWDEDRGSYYVRSVALGDCPDVYWFPNEIEAHGKEQTNAET